MPFRTFANHEEAVAYAASLDERWPDRAAVRAHLSEQLSTTPGSHVVEFCAGAGALAEQLLADHAHITYTAIDITAPLIAIGRQRLARYDGQITWLEADLNENAWQSALRQPVDAFVSLQSLHDLGDEAAVARIMGLAAKLLVPNGHFVYADMLAPQPPEVNNNPGKLSVQRHLDLLRAAGFATATCTWQTGVFGCFVAQRA